MKKIMLLMVIGLSMRGHILMASGGGYGHFDNDDHRQKKVEHKDNVALEGHCAVCVVEMGHVMKGNPKFQAQYKGETYYFPAQKQLSMFQSNPEKYTAPNVIKKYHSIIDAQRAMHDHDGAHQHY